MWKKIIVVIVVLGAVSIALYLVWKRNRDKSDRLVLNGMTRKEFLSSIRPLWESEYKKAMHAYISDPATEWNRAIIDQLQSKPLPANSADYEQMKQEAINTAVDWAWAKDPNPMDIEWARTFWLPKVIDGMDINTNDKLVEELLYKI